MTADSRATRAARAGQRGREALVEAAGAGHSMGRVARYGLAQGLTRPCSWPDTALSIPKDDHERAQDIDIPPHARHLSQ